MKKKLSELSEKYIIAAIAQARRDVDQVKADYKDLLASSSGPIRQNSHSALSPEEAIVLASKLICKRNAINNALHKLYSLLHDPYSEEDRKK